MEMTSEMDKAAAIVKAARRAVVLGHQFPMETR